MDEHLIILCQQSARRLSKPTAKKHGTKEKTNNPRLDERSVILCPTETPASPIRTPRFTMHGTWRSLIDGPYQPFNKEKKIEKKTTQQTPVGSCWGKKRENDYAYPNPYRGGGG